MDNSSTLSAAAAEIAISLDAALTQRGESLADLSERTPLLVVFLRHAGCTFCREAMSDIAASRSSIEAAGARILIVHMGDEAPLLALLESNGLIELDRISDPNRSLYRAFGLRGGSAWQLFGAKVIWRACLRGVLLKHGMGGVSADVAQMPGVFYLEQSSVVRRFRHRSVADRPDYTSLTVRNSSGG